ncbi:YVTN family beta-propeller repeat protein [Microvirga arsenatis]|uniref:Beta-propeller fold lactonase family protein n=1 Tax=Microvirga arsenatis TaxID=2692265 RepID=A0ABW9Z3A1_9HYPH|nr:beta-propeller fold lactonase family protein [Microvirga arsenatis]NBJ13063.1 beta-propeller fold lactonase family protein [Microvirga arsenatis]NBJ26818.1 beta-propeller fold lactonase family protein [Microvirga arsenatis]
MSTRIFQIALALTVSLGAAGARADTIFVANENGQSVSIIDTETSKTTTVAIPISPHNVDLTRDGRLLLATGMAAGGSGGHAAHGAAGGGQLVLMDVSDGAPASPTVVTVGGHPAHVVPDAQGRFAYLSDAETNSVVVVDLAARKVAARIPVQNYPHGLRLSPDGSLLAVANMKSGTVSLVDPRNPEKVEHVAVGERPVQVAFAPSGRVLVVSLNGEDKVAIVDVASRKVLRKASVGRGPVQVFVTPDAKTALVANQGSAAKPDNRVSVIALETGRSVKNLTVGKGAHSIVIDPDGDTAYVTNTYADTISAVDLDTLSVGKAYPVGKGPNGIAAR